MVALARLVDTHGTRGEIKAHSLSGETEHLLHLPHGEVRRAGTRVAVEIESARTNKKEVLFRFVGVATIEDAQPYLGGELWAPREYGARRSSGEYYVRDLVGMSVLSDGGVVGSVVAVYDGTQAPLLEVHHGSARSLVPFMDEYVGTIDEEQRTLEITKRWVLDFE